jgi:phosphoenolpyruvate carboxylase
MMTSEGESDLQAPASSVGLVDGYSRWELLTFLLMEVVEHYEPQAARALRGEPLLGELTPRALVRTLQAQSILFQLLAIAEQNRDMRNRRALERGQGREAVKGTFSAVFSAAARAGITADRVSELLHSMVDPA